MAAFRKQKSASNSLEYYHYSDLDALTFVSVFARSAVETRDLARRCHDVPVFYLATLLPVNITYLGTH